MEDITVTGFRWVPPFAEGLARDLRLRWALGEAEMPYAIDLIDFGEHKSDAYRLKHPFGLVPVFEADGQGLFESGAILLKIAESSQKLMPLERTSRDNVLAWMFAALSTVEPTIRELTAIDFQHKDAEWAKLRRPGVVDAVNALLVVLDHHLEVRAYLVDRFTVADILMVTVLRLLRHTDLVAAFATLDAYVRRCEARPAFQRALDEQIAGYACNAPVPA